MDINGDLFWNGTEACCDFYGPQVDDGAYIMSLVDEVSQKFNVDTKRVYIGGHSNGMFLSFNVACHYSDRIAAIFGVAGMMYKHKESCKPTSPVSLLHVHGTKDMLNIYDGGFNHAIDYASVNETVSYWADYNRCTTAFKAGTPFNMDTNVAGDNTTPYTA